MTVVNCGAGPSYGGFKEKGPVRAGLAAVREEGRVRYRITVDNGGGSELRDVRVSLIPPFGDSLKRVWGHVAPETALLFEHVVSGDNPGTARLSVDWAGEDGIPQTLSLRAREGEYEGGGNVASLLYKTRDDLPPLFGPAGRDLGVLEGTWLNMGRQLAARTGPSVLSLFDVNFQILVDQLGSVESVVEAVSKYEREIARFSPQAVEFMRGIAEGSAPYFDKSRFAHALSHYGKVVFLNSEYCMKMGYPGLAKTGAGKEPGNCSGIAVLPQATADGSTLFAHNCDSLSMALYAYGMTYVALPSERGALPYWASTMPGKINALMAVNGLGVGQVIFAGPNKTWIPEKGIKERAFGVPWPVIQFMQAAYARDSSEAADILIHGTPEYRALTGRSTLLRARQNNWLLVDENRACVVEATAHRYAVRNPGDFGEDGFICSTNHFLSDHSYDETGKLTSVPMTLYGNEDTQVLSKPRYYTLYWLAKRNLGRINAAMIAEWQRAHFYINKEGERVDYEWDEKLARFIPAHLTRKTLCNHSGGYPENYTGTTTDSKLAVLNKNLVYWSFGRPCEYEGLPRAFFIPDRRGG